MARCSRFGGGSDSTPSLIDSFNGSNGQKATGGLTVADGVLYGTTVLGGALGGGTLFSVRAGGGSITSLGAFKPGISGGTANPHVVVLNGFVYGTTASAFGSSGTVYKVPIGGVGPATPVPTTPFQTGVLTSPTSLVNDGGILAGINSGDGPTGHGSIFTVNPTSLQVAVPVYFNSASSPNTGGADARLVPG